jgi:hypothetical protein
MKKIWIKASILAVLCVSLVVLVAFGRQSSGHKVDRVKITEKYYPQQKDGEPIGIKSKQKLSLNDKEAKKDCAMKFDNGKTFDIECDRYVKYRVGEEVKITYADNELIKIRRK